MKLYTFRNSYTFCNIFLFTDARNIVHVKLYCLILKPKQKWRNYKKT